jgi:hypothetical protein
MRPKRPLWIPSLVLLLIAVSAPLLPADSPEAKTSDDTPDSRRLLVGIGLSTNDFSLDAVGDNMNLALVSSFKTDILPFVTLGARAWVDCLTMYVNFDARDVALTWLKELIGLSIAHRVVVGTAFYLV